MLFIDAANEVTRERAQSFLKPEHQQRIVQNFRAFTTEEGFSAVATLEQVAGNGANLSIPLYVKKLPSPIGRGAGGEGDAPATLRSAWEKWQTDGGTFWRQMDELTETLDHLTEMATKS